MRIIAIDPGYDRLGAAILEKRGGKESLVFSCCITTDKKFPHEQRLLRIGAELAALIKQYEPEAMALEKLFLATNRKTAMLVAEARGVCLYEAARAGIAASEYTPLQIKIAVTGYGKSDKRQVTAMVKRLVKLADKKRLDDEYDAIAVGLTHLATAR